MIDQAIDKRIKKYISIFQIPYVLTDFPNRESFKAFKLRNLIWKLKFNELFLTFQRIVGAK
jgi:hypothetical protein